MSRRISRWLAGVLALAGVGGVPGLGAQPSPTAITDRLRTKYLRPIDFHAAVFPDTVWVGQQATYQVAVLLNADARSRLRRNPEFLPPELRGLLAYELGTPQRVPPRSYGTDTYEAHVFQRALFAVAPGTLVVPSPQLTYSLPQSSSYFSREERYTVAAESIRVVVKPLPEAGRPAEFSGAIGTFRLATKLDTASARMGDPLVLTVRVEGIGNVKLLPRPTVEVSWASTVAGTERVQVDSSGAFIRGAKEFDYILTPTQAGPAVLPVVRYSYFDPFKGQYAVASTLPADVTIAEGSIVSPGTTTESDRADLLPLRNWRGRPARTLGTLPAAVRVGALALALLLPMLVLADAMRRRTSRRSAPGGRRPATAMPTGAELEPATADAVARRVRRSTMAALAPRLQVRPADLVARADLERVLRRRGVTRETTRELLELLDALAEVGFGPAGATAAPGAASVAPSFAARAERLLQRVGTEAVVQGRTRLWSRRRPRTGMLALLVVVGSLVAPRVPLAQAADERVANGEAVAAYGARRFPQAAARYADLVARRPGDVDLLVNWGTAAWAANDTVAAVVAWQRAARREPLAPDIQERLAMLPAGARVGIAAVPMVPVLACAAVAWIAWLAGWSVWLWGRRRQAGTGAAAPGRSAAVSLLLLAAAAAGTAAWGARALDDAALAVVRRPETLRAGPQADANSMGGTATGDVVRVLAVQQGWEQVEHADGRQGWMPSVRLVRLANPLLDVDRSR